MYIETPLHSLLSYMFKKAKKKKSSHEILLTRYKYHYIRSMLKKWILYLLYVSLVTSHF